MRVRNRKWIYVTAAVSVACAAIALANLRTEEPSHKDHRGHSEADYAT